MMAEFNSIKGVNKMSELRIGWAQTSITPDRPVYVPGQIYPRASKYVHDPVTATALALDNGGTQAIMVSLDMVSPPANDVAERIRQELSDLDDFDPRYLSMSVTHTHNSIAASSYIFDDGALERLGAERIAEPEHQDNLLKGEELNAFLVERVVRIAKQAWRGRKPGGISTAGDYAAVAFNRRPVFENDGVRKTVMYGDCARDDFKRFEAGSDHSADMIYTWDEDGKLTGVVVCIPCPSQVFELHSFITADYWHYTRKALREKLGENCFVLPLCGAAGDQNPLDLTRISKFNARELVAWGAQAGEVFRNFDMADVCRDIADRISEAVVRGMRKACNYIDTQPVFEHVCAPMRLPIRQVSEQDYLDACKVVDEARERFSPENPMHGADLVGIFEPMGVIGRYLQQNQSAFVDVPMHVMRIGDASLVTCPFELFVEFSLRIKSRAASPQTIVVQLTDDSLGYLPTQAAIEGGSYSSAPASTTCGPDCGDMIVEEALNQIRGLWSR